jgi:tellurite resistance protein
MKLPTEWLAVPASYFSVILGLAGLGSAWRRAHQVWGYPSIVAELVLALAGIVWAYLLLGYVGKWLWSREAALKEAQDPVQCCFIGLVGVATMLIAGAALPYSRSVALALMLPGCAFTIGFGVWRTGALWGSERNDSTTTAVLYLPTVAGGFVSAILMAALGWRDWGQMAFGAALLSWLAIESVLLRRLYIGPTLPAALRTTMGVQLAPPAVGLVAFLSVSDGAPGLVSHALLGYALLQALVLVGRLRWIAQQAFSASYWAFSFGVTALGQAPMIMLTSGVSQPAKVLAPLLFGAANLIVGLLLIGTIRLVFNRRVLPGPNTTSI